MNRSVIRVIAGLLVFAMLASVVALIFAASSTTEPTQPSQNQLEAELLEQFENGGIDPNNITVDENGQTVIQLDDLEDLQDLQNLEDLQDSSTEDALPATGPSGLPSESVLALPAEAADTLQLIAGGGPYPYDQDGTTFQNREGLLPDQEIGYYQEFTVDTPGLDHRGARRFVMGAGGELYYTADHYESFSEVLDWAP